MSLFAGLFGLAIVCGALWAARGSGQRPAEAAIVVYVGQRSPQEDGGFQRFEAALMRASANLAVRPHLKYAQVTVGEEDHMTRSLAQVLSTAPTVVITPTAGTALAAVRLPRQSAVIFSTYPDPVRWGMAESMRAPGRRATGVSLNDTLNAKRLELLRDAFPNIQRVGVLLDSGLARREDFESLAVRPAAALGLAAQAFVADSVAELDTLMHSAEARRMDAWYIPPTYIAFLAEAQVIAHLQRLQVPAIHATEREVARGALMAYSQDNSFVAEALADLTVRVLRGEDPGQIPIQRPKKFTLSVRPREGEGALPIHPAVVRRADLVF